MNSVEDINEASLSLFTALEPKIDVLILGIGDQTPSPNISKEILSFMRKYKINVEVLRTEQVSLQTLEFLSTSILIICIFRPVLRLISLMPKIVWLPQRLYLPFTLHIMRMI